MAEFKSLKVHSEDWLEEVGLKEFLIILMQVLGNSVIRWLLESLEILLSMLKVLRERLLLPWMLSTLSRKTERIYMVMEVERKCH